MRQWIECIVAVVLLVAAASVPPIVTYLFIVAAFALVFDAGSYWLMNAGGTGGMGQHKQ